jgi:lipid kinase YegS
MISRLLLNGKSAALPALRGAVQQLRDSGIKLEVRVTYEGGDGIRLVREACAEGVDRIIVGGGDRSIHEVLNGLLTCDADVKPVFGILPLGTVNDFARSCMIPGDPFKALQLAATGESRLVDVGRANDRYFLNVATGGFGVAFTTTTPPEIRRILGNAAYSLMGLAMAANFQPYSGELVLPDQRREIQALVGAVGNGRQAGGQMVTPGAYIDDGLLDVLAIREFPMSALGRVVAELQDPGARGRYVTYHQVPWLELRGESEMPMRIDGEPVSSGTVRFEAVPLALNLVLPPDCPLISGDSEADPDGEQAD